MENMTEARRGCKLRKMAFIYIFFINNIPFYFSYFFVNLDCFDLLYFQFFFSKNVGTRSVIPRVITLSFAHPYLTFYQGSLMHFLPFLQNFIFGGRKEMALFNIQAENVQKKLNFFRKRNKLRKSVFVKLYTTVIYPTG